MGKTSIEWCRSDDGTPGRSWNPIAAYYNGQRGWFCTHKSSGCEHCYAASINKRLGNGLGYIAQNEKWIEWKVIPKILEEPLHWKKPSRVFTCSMTDLFHESIPIEITQQVWRMMVRSYREHGHTFICLTKRPEVMRERLGPRGFGWYATELAVPCPEQGIWLGVSCEDQKTADERITILLQTPAAVRFVSVEPLLGPIDISPWLRRCVREPLDDGTFLHSDGLDWIIVGGESGPHARPMHPDWARSIRDQCQASGVAFFHKQNGEYLPCGPVENDDEFSGGQAFECASGGRSSITSLNRGRYIKLDDQIMEHVGKRCAGRLLDGVEWSEFPKGNHV